MLEQAVVAGAVAAVTLVACSGRTGPPVAASSEAVLQTPSVTAAAHLDVVDGERLMDALCGATTAETVAAAHRRFMSDAHGPLHGLARAVVEVDRQVAGRLHETKQAAEAALAAGDPDDVKHRLMELTDASRASLQALDQPTSGCEDKDER